MELLGTFDLVLFVAATFAAALVAGVAGFAFGIVATAVWLFILTPLQAAILVASYGLIVQGYAVWKLRRAIRPSRLLPFVIGGLAGIPIGAALLRWTPTADARAAVGACLIAFGLYNLLKPPLRPLTGDRPLADGGVGLLSGVLGGATGLGGILPTIWSTLRGWPRDEQRAVFQPTAVAIFVGTTLWLGGTGSIDGGTVRLFVLGLPALLAGTWAGLRLYGHLDEAGFRRIVLILLLVAGVALVAPSALPR